MNVNIYSRNGGLFSRTTCGWQGLVEMLRTCFTRQIETWAEWCIRSGAGMNAEQSRRLADAIDAAILSGEVDRYVKERDARIDALPDDTCTVCCGSGVRHDDVGQRGGQPDRIITEVGHPRYGQIGWCSECNGVGTIPPEETWHRLDSDDVREFSAFVRAGGGFEIK